jgi:hypothetical protein
MSEAFDRLAKEVAGGSSRRGFLGSLGGLLAGIFLAAFPGKAGADRDDNDDDDDDEAIEQACKKYCSACPRRPRSVHGHCIEHCNRFLHRNPKGTLCGTCTAANPFTGCKVGATCCTPKGAAAFCTNTNTDVKNCSACGNACTKGTTPGCCKATCTDLATDANNCGKCGTACPTANPNCCAGACTNTQTDNNNCGACGTACATGKTCTAGKCG